MAPHKRKLFVCSCERSMPLDTGALGQACPNCSIETANELCRSEIDRVRQAVAEGEPILVACTQEAPLFSEIAEAAERPDTITFANIRETAGWSSDASEAAPKMAALLAAADEPLPETSTVALTSEGVTLVYGRDERAVEAAGLLKDSLDVTVLLSKPTGIAPPRVTEFPVVKGTIRQAKGYLGSFELTVDDYAAASPSSRDVLKFEAPRDGAVSRCDVILDLSGHAPLFPASDLRDGYLRADPGDPAAVLRAVMRARELVGTFDKPRYIAFTEHLCAHSRSRIVGCRRCLDLCPAGAITPDGDHVRIDEHICAGCGACAAACPTGAAAYALPAADALMRKLRTLLTVYRQAGGKRPILLVHETIHGGEMIDALARYGKGLPANVLPVAVNEVTQIGPEIIAAAFAYGASAVRLLLRAKARHDVSGLRRTIELSAAILNGLGFDEGSVETVETDDPDALGDLLRSVKARELVTETASFRPVGNKRDVVQLAMRELQRVSPQPVELVALAEGAPFGKVELNDGCTLCLSCVSACPTGALSDNPEKPMLKFSEAACVQCGLCKATCPEKVIRLVPQIDFQAATKPPRILKEEEPFYCVSCGKPFGTKSTIERVVAKLEGGHWMFKGAPERLQMLKMCDDCRVVAITAQSFDPYGAPERPRLRTSEDYLREREKQEPKA